LVVAGIGEIVSVFFFQITHAAESLPPTELDLPHPDAAWEEATVTAGEVLRDLGGKFRPGTEWRLDVADATRETIFSLRIIGEAFT
jgi:hypothetical protein